MKPASFTYHRPSTAMEAVALLRELGDEAKVLAGGQSLVPLMNFRLARPEHIIDINGLDELSDISVDGDGLRIGAMVRQTTLLRDPLVGEHAPIVPAAVRWIGHPHIRNRGTIGGNLAHADPAGELAVVSLALDATITVLSPDGVRTVAASEFFLGPLMTILAPDEMVTEVRFATRPTGWGFREIARRHGDFAVVLAAVTLDRRDDHVVAASVALGGVASTAVRSSATEAELMATNGDLDAAAEAAMADVDPTGDVHASADYRRRMVGVMVREAVEAALT